MTTAVIQIAGVGLLPNPVANVGVALRKPAVVSNSISSYNSLSTVSLMGNIIDEAALQAKAGNITFTEYQQIATIGQDSFPALTNVLTNNITATQAVTTLTVSSYLPSINYAQGDYAAYNDVLYKAIFSSRNDDPEVDVDGDGNPSPWIVDTDSYKLSNSIDNNAGNIVNEADNTKFTQTYFELTTYMDSLNSRINTNNNSELLNLTFTPVNGGMNYVTTGATNVVTSDYQQFAEDLILLGNLINFEFIDDFGLPSRLLAQISASTGRRLPELNELMVIAGFNQQEINGSVSGETAFTLEQEKDLYNILLGIEGETLNAMKALLGVRLDNVEIAADLLDPRVIFPRSYQTLNCILTKSSLVPIYTDSTTVNMELLPQFENDPVINQYLGGAPNNSYNKLKKILPPDEALAVKAFANSIKQVKNYQSLTPASFAMALLGIQDNTDLPLIDQLTDLIPADVQNYYAQDLALGTGTGNLVVLDDLFGTISSNTVEAAFDNAVVLINSVDTSNVESAMQSLYDNLVAGNASGNLGSVSSAIDSLVANNAANVATLNTETVALGNLLYRNVYNQRVSVMDWDELIDNDQQSAIGFSQELHQIGTDQQYNTGNMISRIANLDNLGGQAVEAALREGKNQEFLNGAGVELDNEIPDVQL